MDRFVLYLLLGLITLPWWRAVLEGVVRGVWSAGEVRELDSPSTRARRTARLPPRWDRRRSTSFAILRETRTAREPRSARRRWEAGFGRRGL